MATSYLYRLWSFHKASGHVHRWHMSTKPGYQSAPTDTPASLPWMPWVLEPVDMTIGIASLAQAKGAIGTAPGRLTLENVRDWQGSRSIPVYDETSGAWITVVLGARPLNILLTDYALAGWPFEEWVVEDGAPFSTATLRIRGTMEVPVPTRSRIAIGARDRTRDFDAPILSADTYTGGGGLAGGEDLTDKTKERFFGHGYCEPTYLGVVGGKHTYSVNAELAIEDVPVFWDEAFRLTKLSSGSPVGGEWVVDPLTGIISVGGDRPKAPLCEVKGDKTGGVWRRHLGEVVRFLADGSGFTTVNAASVAALDATPRTIGLWLPAGDRTTYRAVFDKATGSVARGYWLLDATGEMHVGRLPAPGGVSKAGYRRGSGTTGLKPRETSDRGLPTTKVVLRFAEVAAALRTTVANATDADVALLKNRWREATAEDPAIATAYPRVAQTATIETLLFDRAQATAEAGEFLSDMAEPPLLYDLPLDGPAADIDLRDTVSVTDDIAWFETGKNVVVVARTVRRSSGNPTLTVRG